MKSRLFYIAICAIVILSSCNKKEVLYVYNWSDFIDKEVLTQFENENDVKIKYTNYSSNEELETSLVTGGKYDVIFPSDYMVTKLRKANILDTIYISKLANFKNIEKVFQNVLYDPIENGTKFSIPYQYWTTGIAINTEKVVTNIDSTYNLLFDKSYGKGVTLLNEVRYTIGMVLIHLGYSPNETDPEILQKVQDLMVAQKKDVVIGFKTDIIDMLIIGEPTFSYGYSGDIFQAIDKNEKIKFMIPKEGTIIGVDNICIPSASSNKELAYKFIDFMLRPEIAAKNSNATFYATPNKKACTEHLVNNDLLLNKTIFLEPKFIEEKCYFLIDIGKEINTYNRIFEYVKNN